MVRQQKHLYEFGPFALDAGERRLLRDGAPVSLAPKAFETLVVLVQNGGRLLSKEELMKAVWPDVTVEEGNLSLNVSLIRKALGDSSTEPQYVETVTKWGYRFIAPVQESGDKVAEAGDTLPAEVTNAPEAGRTPLDDKGTVGAIQSESAPAPVEREGAVNDADRLASPFGGHLWHVFAGCGLYALLYVDALFLEIAYQFDRLGPSAFKLSPLVFLWIFGTSVAALWLDWRRTLEGKTTGLALSLTTFISAGILLYAALGLFLPSHPVTEADFQTYPAQGAYLKSVYYFLPLGVIFLLLPYHFVVSVRRALRDGRHRDVLDLLSGRRSSAAPTGTVYLRSWWLVVTLAIAVAAALVAMAHLFEGLKPNPHSGLFVQLAQWRLLLYVILGLECTLWYYWTLNEIKRECVKVGSAGRKSAG